MTKSTRFVWLCVACILISTTTLSAQRRRRRRWEPQVPIWQLAAETYKAGEALYIRGDWSAAAKAMGDFTKKFPGHESVPVAWLQIAHCRYNLSDSTRGDKAMDTILQRFPDSYAAEFAWGRKLANARSRNDHDGFLKLYQKLTRRLGRAPFGLSDRLDWRRTGDYWHGYQIYLFWTPVSRSGYKASAAGRLDRGWGQRLLSVADTPGRVDRLLQILLPTFKQWGRDLPTDWKYLHVQLLRRATKAEEAQAKFLEYTTTWAKDDPRVMSLWLAEAEYAQSAGEEARADGIYQNLLSRYTGFSSLAARLPARFNHLRTRGRYKDFTKLARQFLKTYPLSGWRNDLLGHWFSMANGKGRTDRAAEVLKLLEAEKSRYPLNTGLMWQSIHRRVELLLVLGKTQPAVELARSLVDKRYWSSRSFSALRNWSSKNKAFAPLVARAREKWTIPLPNSGNPAAKMLQDLRRRIGNEKLRHMEEIGDEMYQSHRREAETIEAIRSLVNFYFKKVLYDQRDKWAEKMVAAYPYHPATEAVLIDQINAKRADKDYAAMAPLTETAMANLPGSGAWGQWFNFRVECYEAEKDIEGRIHFARKHLRKRAESGELAAIGRLGSFEEKHRKTYKERGDYWMDLAPRHAGNYRQEYCLNKAFYAYYTHPVAKWQFGEVDFPSALRAARALYDKTSDLELRWKLAFEDINLLSQAREGRLALEVLASRLAGPRKSRRKKISAVGARLDMNNLGRALGLAKLAAEAEPLLSRLQKRCYSNADAAGLTVTRALMYHAQNAYVPAAQEYLALAQRAPWPTQKYKWFRQAAECMKSLNSTDYVDLQMGFIRQFKTAQDVVPRLLRELMQFQLGRNRRAGPQPYLGTLIRNFPASKARGDAENALRSK